MIFMIQGCMMKIATRVVAIVGWSSVLFACLPGEYSDANDEYDEGGELTCADVAACVDEQGAENLDYCVSLGSPEASSAFQQYYDCVVNCGEDERCDNRCNPLASACLCAPGQIISDSTGECTRTNELSWIVAVAYADVSGFCGLDGVGADEFYHNIFLNGAIVYTSSESDCFDNTFARWAQTETWDYAGEIFSVDVMEADVVSDDTILTGIGFRDGAGDLSAIPQDVLTTAAAGEIYPADVIGIFADYR